MILNIVVVLPNMIKKQNWQVDQTDNKSNYDPHLTDSDTSLIISIFSLAQLIFAPINASVKNFLGAKNAVLIGFCIMSICTFGLGTLIHIKDPLTFKIVANTLRLF